MAQPTAYTPAYSFSDFQTENPSTPLPADKLDVELSAIQTTTDGIRANLAGIQRDDGQLANGVVTPESFTAASLALMSGFDPKGDWVTATAYLIGDLVNESGASYVAAENHTSGTFATDLAAGKWIIVAGSSGSAGIDDLTDVTISTVATGHLLGYNGSAWVNAFLGLGNVPDGLLTFAKLNSAVFTVDGALASVSDTKFATSKAVKTYVDTEVGRDTGTDVAAASTTDISGAYDYVNVTGNTGITAITLAENEQKWVTFTGTPVITHNATSLILPGAANITAAAGDRALFRGLASGNVICLSYQRASGQAVAVASGSASLVSVNKQVITSSMTYTPTAGMLFCIVELLGGGGGGGSSTTNAGGGGGSSGALAVSLLTAADIGASKSITIGAGGSAGNAGGSSSVGTLMVAPGGLAGGNASSNTGGAQISSQTAVSGSKAHIAINSAYGTPGQSAATAIGLGGKGADSRYGSSGAPGGPSNDGGSGSGYGAGGSAGGAGHAAAAGLSGVAVIWEFCSQ